VLNDALPSNTRPKLPHYNMAALPLCKCSPDCMVFLLRDGCTQHEGGCHNLLTRVTSYLPGWSCTVGIKTGHMLAKRKEQSTPSGKDDEAAAWSHTVVTCLDSNIWLWEGDPVGNVANYGGGGAWQCAGQPAQASCKLQQASQISQDGS